MTDKILTEAVQKLTQIEEYSTPDQKQFVVSVAWSQTDQENVLVTANSRLEAEKKVKHELPGIHHITGSREIHIVL